MESICMGNNEKSLGKNAILNGLKSVLSVVFPLITYPYVLRVLQVENIGKVDFSNSIVNYFILLAGLGINTYAIREGAAYKNERRKLESFSSEIFTINTFSSILSIILLLLCVVSFQKLYDYRLIIAIQSVTILGNLIGVLWLYQIVEDYEYITIRAIAIHVVALILMFALVQKRDDYLAYAATSVIANTGANIFNFFHARKYAGIRLVHRVNIKRHLKPILIIFASAIASTIYVNSDKTLLGIITNDYHVGLYSAAVNVYTILKICMMAVIQVALPRLSRNIAEGDSAKYRENAEYIFKLFLVLLLPIVTGTFLISEDIVIVVGGYSYAAGATALRILSVSLLFSILATFYTYAVLLPYKQEKTVLFATVTSALVNVVLNLIVLKRFQENGAAMTTVIAEMIMFLVQWKYSRKYIKTGISSGYYGSVIVGCLAISAVCITANLFIHGFVVSLIVKIIGSTVAYGTILLLMKNETIMPSVNRFFGKKA